MLKSLGLINLQIMELKKAALYMLKIGVKMAVHNDGYVGCFY